MKVLDTFAGAGGFSLGFELAGCEVIGGIECDRWASDTFAFNHKNADVLTEPIERISDKVLLSTFGNVEPDVVLGGPPCQGFSICNRNAGDPKDPRNSLFREFIRMGRLFHPRMMVMENVPNLLKAKTESGQPVIDIIVEELQLLGYHVYFDVLEATNFGVPQIRKRLFVVASKSAVQEPFPAPTHLVSRSAEQSHLFADLLPCPSLWDAISDLPQIEARQGAEEMGYDRKPINSYQAGMRVGASILHNHVAMKHSRRLVERFAAMSWGHSTSDLPDQHRPQRRNGNGEMSDKVYDQNNRRMHPDKPCHTVPASFYANFVHPYSNRNFTAREGARIQSFPDRFVFKGKPTVVSRRLLAKEERHDENHLCQYNQIGNAVPPLMAKAIAANLLRHTAHHISNSKDREGELPPRIEQAVRPLQRAA